jgi:hypothetical protein
MPSLEKPKKLQKFRQFPTPPTNFWNVSLWGWPTNFGGVTHYPFISNKYLTLQKKLWQSQTHLVVRERFPLEKRVLVNLKKATALRIKNQKSIEVKVDNLVFFVC